MVQSKKQSSKSFLAKILFRIFLLVTRVDVSYSQSSNKTCSILYSRLRPPGQNFAFTDFDQSVNLIEDLRVSDEGWKITNSIQVEPGCRLQTCNETYLGGTCSNFAKGSYSLASSSEAIASAQCVCEKQCQCADVFVKKSSCGRAYVQSEGCSTCNALYINLNGNNKYFPEKYMDNVRAIKLRKGCTLTTYAYEDFEGDKLIVDRETIENFSGTIGSYECNCDDDLYEPSVRPPRQESYPELIEIPNSMDDVIKMLATDSYKNHSGLLAALASSRNRRSTKNAYILLLGSAGAGKTSAINLLFDNPNFARVESESSSTATSINEFRIPMPIDKLGISNSELRIIDTPGIGDTRGLEQDAKNLASLDSYLSNHEELKDRLPNVVLIFHKYNDNRFGREGSYSAKMIRGMDYFSKRTADKNYSNVVFVFSHFCSATRKERLRPEDKLRAFKKVIENYTLFPKPIHLVVAENKPIEHELSSVNGYYKLPNNEYCPKNIFDKLELVTRKGRDSIGQNVFKIAFRDYENFNVYKSSFPLFSSKNEKVEYFLRLLVNSSIGFANPESKKALKCSPGQDRARTQLLINMVNAVKRSNERFFNLTIEMKKSERETENKWLEMEKEQMIRQMNQKIESNERKEQEQRMLSHYTTTLKRQGKLEAIRQVHEEKMAYERRYFDLTLDEVLTQIISKQKGS